MNRSPWAMLLLVAVVIAGILALPWALIGAGQPGVAPSNGFTEFAKEGPPTSTAPPFGPQVAWLVVR
jgi:hypothetical protein